MKTFTKHILLLALMLFGVAGAAWALPRAPQKFTGPVDIDNLVQGDTLAPGFSLICNGESKLRFPEGTVKINGSPREWDLYLDCSLINNLTYGSNGAMLVGSDAVTPAYGDGQDGNAWVVTSASFDEYYRVTLAGIYIAPDPYVPALDELTGHWNFLMPGSNKVVKAVLLDSIVVGPHVTVVDLAFEGKYANGTDTVYYYDTNSHSSLTLTAAGNDGQGRNFGYWADLDPTDSSYSCYYRYIDSSSLTCGDTFRAVYLDNHTLTLNVPQGGTLELAGVTEETVYTIYFDHDGTDEGDKSITVPASRMPYDTIFSYNDKITFADAHDQQGESVSMVAKGAHTIIVRISGAFDYGGYYSCNLEGGATDEWSISCMAGTGPVPTYGITKTGNNTYSVMEGLTVNVTATPDSAHYLARIDGLDTVSNAACGYTFTMPGNDYPLMADFNDKPTLTLDQTDGGTLEAIVPEGVGEETLLTTVTATSLTTSSQSPDGIVTVTLNNIENYYADNGWVFNGSVTVEAAQDYTITRCVFKQGSNLVIADDQAPFTATMGFDGDDYYVSAATSTGVVTGDAFGISSIEVYGYQNGTPNVIASSTPNTYIIDYGTPVTVVATPDAQHYLVSFSDDDNDTNSNLAVEKTYDSVVNNINLSANFQAKPTLTLTANDGGTLTLDGMTTRDSALYNITINNQPQNITAYPYQKVFNFDGDVMEVSGGDANVSITKTGQKQVTVTVNRGFSGTVNLGGAEFDGEDYGSIFIPVSGTPAGSIQLVELPAGVVSANATLDTFVVDYGTTVTVTAKPDSIHYLATLGGVTMGSNTAKDTTFTLTATTNLAANFAQKPTLTLAHNDGGTLEAIVPQGGATAMHPTTDQIPTWSGNTEYAMEADLQPFGFVAVDSAAAAAWTGVPASGQALLLYAPAGNSFKAIIFQDGQWYGAYTANFYKTEFYTNSDNYYFTTGAVAPNVIASSTPNTYYIDYNTSVTVKATPSDTAYLVRFDQDADINSNVAAEKTYGPLTAALTTAEATFNAKPVLTLAQNESWGSVSVSGPVVWNNQVWGSWDMISTSFPQTIGDITINKNNFYCYNSSGKLLLHRSVDNNSYVTFTSAGDNFTRIEMTYTGGSNLEPANEWTCENGVAVWEGDAQSVTITNANNFYFTQIKFIRGSGIAQLTDTTYRIDYGTTVTVKADATELHHIANWVDADSVDYPAADITYSAYFITEPEPLFPDSSTLTLTVTADATAKALFGINYRNLLFSHNDGGHMEFVVEQDSMLFAGIATTSVTRDDITITAGQADGDGMYLKDEASNIVISIDGGASITQVDFHVTNGTNLVNTIGVDAQGATITTTNNNQYGSIKGLNTPSLTISSSTTHDLQIDQFIIHYGNALPNGVAYGPNDSTWYVMPDTTVIVRAVPDEGHYLLNWASAPDTVRILDTLTVEMTVTTDDTLKAVFAPNPVITLAVNDENAGSVYFTGYQGNTITRAGIIKAQSVDLPYQWYEAGEIMSIEGGNGMVTKDEATSHYLTVSGVFDGTATVVTSAGAFSITSYPTLPNGVRYNIATDNYTITPYTTLSFTATPNPNYYFVDWAKVTLNDTLGFDSLLISTEAVTTVRIDKDMKLQGNFLHNPYVLTLSCDSVMGTIDTIPGQTCLTHNDNGTYTVMTDSTVTLVAAANTGYHITGWQNAQGNQANLTNDTVRITIVSDTTITVNLAGNPVVTLAANGNGAMTVDSLPDYAVDNQNGTYSVLPGTVLNIIATPDTHYYMTRWDDVDSMINSNVAVTRTDTINADTTIGATFAHKPILTLIVHDTAFGTVTIEGSVIAGVDNMFDNLVDVIAASSGYQYGVASDEQYIYTSSWSTNIQDGYIFHQYDQAGNLIDNFNIDGVTLCRDMTSDGQYIYGANGETVYVMDLAAHTLVNTIQFSGVGTVRHISYDPVRDAFWVGNWSSLMLYSRTGSFIQYGPGVGSVSGTAFYQDGEDHLILLCQPNSNAVVYDYNINRNTITQLFDITSAVGVYGSSGGSFIGFVNGKLYWLGDTQNTPNHISVFALDKGGVYALNDTTFIVDYNNDVTMRAAAETGYEFLRWEGANGQVYGTADSLTVTMTMDTLVHAIFDTLHYNLVVNIAEGDEDFGTVEGSVAAAHHFNEYQIVATPDSGYHLAGWYAGVSPATIVGTTDTMVVTLHSDSTFTATFDTNSYNLNVVVADACTGFGTVTGDTIAKHFKSYAISATANPGYHFVVWSDGDSNATRTVELVSDSTIAAIFEFNPALTLDYDSTRGDMKFVVESQTETFTGISTTELSAGAISVNATSADATYGISVKSPNTLTIVAAGDNVIQQVAFHLTNGTNRAENITANHGTLNATNGNAYGTITGINSDTLVISSNSNKDINIDQLTIKYAPVLPAGVVHVDGTPSNVYHVVPGTVVQVMAVPFEGNYLLSWDGDTTSTDDLIATVTMADSDLVVTANFSGDPVMTLTSNGEGRIYFESYAGYTINRDETILMTNYVFNGQNPYTWYEAGEIYEINDPTGMVTYDTATKHYISVHGQFTGTATVVTTSGSFAVTCIPTVPNGVTVMREGMYIIQPGTEVTVVAEPAEEHYLYSWDDITTTENVRDITVTRDTNIVVNFLHNPYTLALVSDSAMGTVAPADGQAFVTANNDGTYTVMADSTVTLVATPAAGFHLTGWSNVDTTDLTIDVTMLSDSTVTVYFDTTHAELAWDTNAFTGYTMIDFNAYKPTLANPNGVEVRYGLAGADSNSAVVVSADSCIISNPMGGVVTTAGTYTVYAVHDLTQEYFYDSVTYDLTVKNGAVIALMKNIDNGGSIEFVNTEADLTHAYLNSDSAKMAFLAPGASFRAVATANEGYHLEGWQTGSIANSFEDFATGDTVLYTAPDTINARIYISGLRAQFDTNHYVLVARAMDSCNGCGIVSIGTQASSPAVTLADARHFVDYTLVATADPCYHFVNWTDTLGNEVSTSDTMVVSPVSDSILVAHFELNVYAGDTTVDVCDQFTWHDSTYTVTPSVAPTFIYKTANNCDSLVTLNLTIRHSSNSDTTAEVCDVMNWYEHQNITGSCDTLKHTIAGGNTAQCDSTLTLHLTVKQSSNSVLDTTVCEEFTWTNHTTYYRSTIAHDTTLNVAGCDSIAYLDLKVNYPSSSEQTVVTCDSVYRWNGFVYTTSTIGIFHTENIYGCDSTATLNLTLNHNFTGYDVQEACESFTWINDSTYTTSQLDSSVTYTYAGGASNGCDSTAILLLTINQPVSTTETVTACESYMWNGTSYTSSTSPTSMPSYTSTGSNGCDSTVTLDLTINNSVTSQFAAQTCSYYIWDGTYYDSTGTYTRTYSAANSCDSVVTMTLTVNSTVTSSFNMTACGSYTWNDVEYAASGAYSHTYQSVYGCDSVVTMRLTLKQPVTTTLTATACNSYEWNGELRTESGEYRVTNIGANGCDSVTILQLTILTTGTSTDNVTACDSYTWINGVTYYETPAVAPTDTVATDNCITLVTLNLTINNSVTSQFDTAACNSYVWDGTFYNQSGSYNKSYSGANSCDSTVTMNLTINQPTTATVSATSCDSYEWNGVTYQNTGTYFATMTGSNGCDSTTTLQLTINQSGTTSETVTACDEYLWNGELRTVSGEYRDTTTGTNGCTMVNILNLTIKNSTSSNFTATACNYYIWNGSYYDSTAVYSRTYRAANGCDSVVTLDLTINRPVDTTINVSSCGSYTWNGVEYAASGAYSKTYRGANGCDSVVTMNLTVKQPVTATESVTACDSYMWNGNSYSYTGTYSTTMTGSNGCDSTTILNLTINNSGTATETVTACNEYEWRGTTYNVSGSYNDTTIGSNNCTLVTTLNLTIKNSTEATENVTACESYLWNGETYRNTGTYFATMTGSNGCDSTTYLNLTVNYGTSSQTDVTACDSYSWNGMNYTVSGTYTFDTVNSLGCDSTATLNLTVKYRTTATEIVTACDSYEWHGTSYTSSTSTPTYTCTGANGCDSTTTLQLTIATTGTSTDNITACDSLTWINGVTYYETPAVAPTFSVTGETCNTIVTLNLTINNSVETSFDTAACIFYIWDGTYYNATGSYEKSYSAANSCDSTVTMNLTINQPVTSSFNETACVSYTWNNEEYSVSGSYSQTFSNVNGCDSTVTLNLTINQPKTVTESVTACDSYMWNGNSYSYTGTYSTTMTGSNGCDSTTVLNLTINHSGTATETITACDEYEWHGTSYTSSTSSTSMPSFTTTNRMGCDSTVTLNLTINNSVESSFDTAACIYYIWDGTYYNQSGSYTKHYSGVNGCDSAVTMTLTVNQPVTSSFSETACVSYTWNNVEYTLSGAYSQTFSNVNGCDSTVTLLLTVNQPKTTTETVTACDSYMWHGTSYTSSTSSTSMPSFTTTGSNGCDSTVYLNLTINYSSTATETVTACDEYTWHGVTYTSSTSTPSYTSTAANGCTLTTTLNLTINNSVSSSVSDEACIYYIWDGTYYNQSGVYNKSYTAANGCDSTVTMTLTVNQPVATSISESVCGSYTWNNVEYAASGVYSQTFTGANGCDSVVTLTLTVKQPKTVTVSVTACDSYTWNGQTYQNTGTYFATMTGSNGCDSTTVLQLTINQTTTASETVTACDSYSWNGTVYTTSGNYSHTTTGVNGCNLITTLYLTINNSTASTANVTACVNYTWNGQTYTAGGTYTYHTTNAAGCDSTATLVLTVNQPTASTAMATACESYTWNGQTYTTSGTYTYTTTNAAGCDSVATLLLTVNQPTASTETVTACGSYEWNGQTYTTSGTYTYTTTNAAGCDSVATLQLTVGNSVSLDESVTTCDLYEWYGRTYTESGTYTHTSTTPEGCDSIITLTLTVNYSHDTTISMMGEGSVTWNGETFTESGTYERTITTVTGCDSVVTLNLVVLPEGFVMPYLYNLMDVMLSVNHNEEGMENVHYIWYRWYRDGELVLEGPDYDSYSENGRRLNGCYHLEVAVDEGLQYWVSSNVVCISSEGIDDVDNLEVTLAPNPVMHGSMVKVLVEGADLQGAEIRVYDLQGRTLLQQKDSGVFEAPQTSGMYMVRLTLADGRTTVKRLIVR